MLDILNVKLPDVVKNKIYSLTRKLYLKYEIGKLGKIKEEDDKFICYIAKIKNNKYSHNLYLNILGIDNNSEIIKELNLNKPLYYVFENITFNTSLDINSRVNLTFKNCTFNNRAVITSKENVDFINNKFINKKDNYYYYFLEVLAKNANFIDNEFLNEDRIVSNLEVAINMGIEEVLNITNSKINTFADIIITSEKIIIDNSEIKSHRMELNAESIKSTNSIINAKRLYVDNEQFDFEENIKSPYINYNGVIIKSNENEIIKIDKEKIKLMYARKQLIESLKKINEKCKEINSERIKYIKNSLNKQTINKVLKKK